MLRAHAVLAEVSLGYPPLKGRFPRATHPCATRGRSPAFDLHVLGMPPAFVLSQDQTLMFNPDSIPSTLGTDPTRAFKRQHPIQPGRSRVHRFMRKRSTTQRRRPRIPSSIQQCQSANLARLRPKGAAAQGGGLIGPSPSSVNVLFRPGFRHPPRAWRSPGERLR